ncbi:MAG: hypothetical protein EON59_15250 [Alphaproteobacteria bacterium]|nr:MAG: hypothetical protein EON59_15250 [Alphaproteobacteria bacterium]
MISDPIIIGIMVASWAFALGVLVLVIRWVLRTRSRNAVASASLQRDEDGSMQVPVLATFTGVAGLPSLLAVASNNLNPSLVIRPGSLTYRVTMSRSVSLQDVATVSVQTTLGTTTLVFTFVGGAFTLSAKVASPAVAETVLTAYPELAAKRVYRAS